MKNILMVTLAIVFSVSIAMIDSVGAGETENADGSATSVNTKWQTIEVGDEEGHVLGLFENTQLWVRDANGEKIISHSRGIMDLNTKLGHGTLQGYNVFTYSNGDKRFSRYDGKLVGKDQWEGTWTEIGGTGKYEGCTGGGTWVTNSLGTGVSEVTAKGERTLK